MKKTLTFIFAFIAAFWAFGQEKCASHTYEQELRAKYPHLGTVEQFEQWMAQKITERRNNPTARTGPYKIATIIHVIHAGDAIGNNSRNIPYGQAISQIRVLNEDFQRTNNDASNTRALFVPRAGSMPDLEFVAATKDPNGNVLPEPGVRRINGQAQFGITVWTQTTCNATLKPATIWNPDQYLNIWVVDFGSAGLFGYAQFPEGSSLPGMPTGTQTSNTDGVVINYRSMGSNFNANGTPVAGGPYITNPLSPGTDRGRTTTHEIGHWLGLRHSWGDGGCTVDDFCADTPWQGGDSPLTTNCASSQTRNTCSTLEPVYGNTDAPDQIENYMDYSADVCMNMFTTDQVNRMYVVMENSPRRNTLTAAAAIVAAPILTGAYAAITPSRTNIVEGDQVSFTGAGRMGDNETPNTITSWQWNFDVDGIGGVTPATFNGQNPGNVTFGRVGNYKVRLTVSNGTTSGFSEVTIVSGLKSPSSLQFPDAQGSGTNAKVSDVARMTWIDNSNSEENYLVERKRGSEPPSAYVTIATLPANSNTYTDNFATASPAIESGVTYTYRITAVKGSATGSVSRNIILERVTALDETPLAREVRIYPNPAQNSFNVDLSGLQINAAKLQLHNTVGQVVAQKVVESGETSFDVQNLPKGMYLLKIETDKGVGVKRIVIQ